MQIKLCSPFLFGKKVTSLAPGEMSMTVVVRGVFRLRPGCPLAPIESLTEQGYLTSDVFRDEDEDREGELLYASDFADFKPKTDLLLRGTCYPGGGRVARECTVTFAVGAWSKSLRVVGRRVWTEKALDPIGAPAPFVSMPLTYTNAFGGVGHAKNPVGKGYKTPELPNIEDPRAPLKSKRDAPEPAGFGPINPGWPARRGKTGKDYGKEWRKTRAPFYSRDFDWSYFNAAPLDQQLAGYLRGDEEVVLEHLRDDAPRFSARLPGVRPRVLVRYHDGATREARMNLDTLFADVDAERITLTWRGLAPVSEDDLADVRTLLIAHEEVASPLPDAHYVALLDDYERDPLERDKHVPPEVKAKIQAAKALAEEQAPKERPPRRADPFDRLKEMVGLHAGDASPEDRATMNDALTKLKAIAPEHQPRVAVTAAAGGASIPPTRDGVVLALRNLIATQKAKLVARGLPTDELDAAEGELRRAEDARRALMETLAAKSRTVPSLGGAIAAAAAANSGTEDKAASPTPGPGANLMGSDLSGQDLRGQNLEGALLRNANLCRAKLAGANMKRADLSEAMLTGADLTGCDLAQANLGGVQASGAIFDEASLAQAIFSKADLTGASFAKARCRMTQLSETTLRGARFRGATLSKALFHASNLERADFSGAEVSICTFLEVSAVFARFDGARLVKSTFLRSRLDDASFAAAVGEGNSWQGASLVRADFRGARLEASHFARARMESANLGLSYLRGSRFERASLAHADLTCADLLGATFNKAKLAETKFVDANLYNAKFFGVVATARCDFTGANLKLAAWELVG